MKSNSTFINFEDEKNKKEENLNKNLMINNNEKEEDKSFLWYK
jgi:hypothetical protein